MFEPLAIKPGLYTEDSDRGADNRWKDGLNVQFFKSYPVKCKGYVKLISTAFAGVCRSMVAWRLLSQSRYLALGTSSKLYLCDTQLFFDITPLSSSGTLAANPFAVVVSTPAVTVTHVAHGRSAGDYVNFTGSTSVGGITPTGSFRVTTVVDTDHYTFDFTSNATSTTSGGGAAVAYEYEIPVGNVDTILGLGWGTGAWGIGTWGISTSTSTLGEARIWSLIPWGEDLLASPQNAPLYIWLATSGVNVRAALITQAPAKNRRILVSDQLRIVISYGSHDGTDQDDMLIRWCDSEDYTNWTPDIINLAGDARPSSGTKIIAVIPTRSEIAIITDQAVISQTPTGDDVVFAFVSKGATDGLLGANAAVDVNGTIYAMGMSKFYTYDGSVSDLPCDVQSRVFGQQDDPAINMVQAAKTFASWNRAKNTVVWAYCSAGSSEVDLCVGINTEDKSWFLGTVSPTARCEVHPFQDSITVPMGTIIAPDGSSYLYKMETGVDRDDLALPYYLESYDAEVNAHSNGFTGDATGQGEKTFRITTIIPDMIRCVGNHYLSLKGRKYPSSRQFTKGPKKFNSAKRHIDMHMRSRQIALRIESDEIGADISVGNWRFEDNTAGRK